MTVTKQGGELAANSFSNKYIAKLWLFSLNCDGFFPMNGSTDTNSFLGAIKI